MSLNGTVEMTSAGAGLDRRDGRGGQDDAGGPARWIFPPHITQHLIRPDQTLSHLAGRLRITFGRYRSPGTSATQHFSLNDLAFSTSIWLLQVMRLFSGHRWLVTQAIGWKGRPWVCVGRAHKLWLRVQPKNKC